MNLTNHFLRSNFVELDRFSSHNTGNQAQRSRFIRDPFEGDPFKIQSLNFRYADKPSFFVSNRGKGQAKPDSSSEVKNLYYNHDHSIPMRDKENLPFRGDKNSSTSKPCNPQKAPSAVSSTSGPLIFDSVASGLGLKKSCMRSFISQPSIFPSNSRSLMPRDSVQSTIRRRPLRASNPSVASILPQSASSIVVPKPTGCQITIKINGIPKNRVQIKRSEGNVHINLAKTKKPTKSTSPRLISPKLRSSRSYVVQKKNTTPNAKNTSTAKKPAQPKLVRGSSTISIIPHRERGSANNNLAGSISGATYRSSSTIPSKNLEPSSSTESKASEILNNQARILERILTNNPIVVKSRMSDPDDLLQMLLKKKRIDPSISVPHPNYRTG